MRSLRTVGWLVLPREFCDPGAMSEVALPEYDELCRIEERSPVLLPPPATIPNEPRSSSAHRHQAVQITADRIQSEPWSGDRCAEFHHPQLSLK